jgi:RimJ/RimL family protein N-acetyltransferase
VLRLRPYRRSDAERVVSWIKSERLFRYWCADRFESYPITADDLNAQYDTLESSGDVYHFTAYDGSGVVGHINIRFPEPGNIDTVRFGYVIIDDGRRGQGLGKEMIKLALRYSFDIMKAKKVTIGVFAENKAALGCYLAAGFKDTGVSEKFGFHDEEWNCMELEITR